MIGLRRLIAQRMSESKRNIPHFSYVEELDVTPGAGIEDSVEVRGNLGPGDRLVVRGGERLADGQAVRVIDPTHRPAAQQHPG